jgi:5-deoxy-glucuronate isomerase
MNTSRLHWPAGTVGDEDFAVSLTPERAGWGHAGLRILRLEAGASRTITNGDEEMAVLPLSGALQVEVEGQTFHLDGRDSVFAAVTDWVYLPCRTEARLHSPTQQGAAEVALPSARATRRFDPVYVSAASVPIEIRGAGPSTRQVTNFMAPGAFDAAERLMCVEVLTPEGNWSSWPPHRHDDSPECPVNNEEIYYFRIGQGGGTGCSDTGFGLHRLYAPGQGIDETVAVRDGDTFLIPRGYHGPSVAAPGYPMYYLNVLAGPGKVRSMAFCDDPIHGWVRESWHGMPPDPRCPMTAAPGALRASPAASRGGAASSGSSTDGMAVP